MSTLQCLACGHERCAGTYCSHVHTIPVQL